MKTVDSYIIKSFSSLFFQLVFIVGTISSIFMFLKISFMTAVVNLTFSEFLQVYLYSFPNIFFYILPITFFMAGVLSLSRLSHENELSVMFALGLKPTRIIKIFIIISSFFSILLLVISFWFIPAFERLYDDFFYEKENTMSINVQKTQFGEKLGSYVLYVGKAQDKKHGREIVLFSRSAQDSEIFITSKVAAVMDDKELPSLHLNNGKGYFYDFKNGNLDSITFKDMDIYSASNSKFSKFQGIIEHWMGIFGDGWRIKKDFAKAIIISLLPIASIFFYPGLGIYNPRIDKNLATIYSISILSIFYIMLISLTPSIPFVSIPLLLGLMFFSGYFVYKKRVGNVY